MSTSNLPQDIRGATEGGNGPLAGRRVVVRVDFNVPMAGDRVLDDTRLRRAAGTIRALVRAGARVLLLSHRGRPRGRVDRALTLRPVAAALGSLLGHPVAFAADTIGAAARGAAAATRSGGVCLFENLRFHAGEERNEPEFAAELGALGEVYVNDAFGAAHRAHASTVGILRHAGRAYSGLLLDRELRQLRRLLSDPPRPFALVTGGAKIGGKIAVLQRLLPLVDRVLVGGGMANTLLAARGAELGSSLVEEDGLDIAREIVARTAAQGAELVLPDDLVVTNSLEAVDGSGNSREVRTTRTVDGVPAGWLAVDIGVATRRRFAVAAGDARTLFWNGPMGVFETPPFDAGSSAVAQAVAACPGFTVVGGGETVAAVRQAGLEDRMGHVSTGGGASLAFLAGEELPAVEALRAAQGRTR